MRSVIAGEQRRLSCLTHLPVGCFRDPKSPKSPTPRCDILFLSEHLTGESNGFTMAGALDRPRTVPVRANRYRCLSRMVVSSRSYTQLQPPPSLTVTAAPVGPLEVLLLINPQQRKPRTRSQCEPSRSVPKADRVSRVATTEPVHSKDPARVVGGRVLRPREAAAQARYSWVGV